MRSLLLLPLLIATVAGAATPDPLAPCRETTGDFATPSPSVSSLVATRREGVPSPHPVADPAVTLARDRVAPEVDPRNPRRLSYLGADGRRFSVEETEEDGERHITLQTPHGSETFRRTGRPFLDYEKRFPAELTSPDFLRGKKVLDTATGDGQAVEDMRYAGIDAYGLDIYLTPEQRRRGHFVAGDLRRTGLEGDQFDVIYSLFGPAHYGTMDLPMMTEMARLLRPNGTIVIGPVSLEKRVRDLAAGAGLVVESTRENQGGGLVHIVLRKPASK